MKDEKIKQLVRKLPISLRICFKHRRRIMAKLKRGTRIALSWLWPCQLLTKVRAKKAATVFFCEVVWALFLKPVHKGEIMTSACFRVRARWRTKELLHRCTIRTFTGLFLHIKITHFCKNTKIGTKMHLLQVFLARNVNWLIKISIM